jgi:hypothetical protein
MNQHKDQFSRLQIDAIYRRGSTSRHRGTGQPGLRQCRRGWCRERGVPDAQARRPCTTKPTERSVLLPRTVWAVLPGQSPSVSTGRCCWPPGSSACRSRSPPTTATECIRRSSRRSSPRPNPVVAGHDLPEPALHRGGGSLLPRGELPRLRRTWGWPLRPDADPSRRSDGDDTRRDGAVEGPARREGGFVSVSASQVQESDIAPSSVLPAGQVVAVTVVLLGLLALAGSGIGRCVAVAAGSRSPVSSCSQRDTPEPPAGRNTWTCTNAYRGARR